MSALFFPRRTAAVCLLGLATSCASAPTAQRCPVDDGAALARWNAGFEEALAARADALAARGAARDLIAAALLRAMPPKETGIIPGLFPDWERPGARAAWARAREHAPDDVLLAWIELEHCPGPCDAQATRERLQRLEPDNAAVWLQAFDAAWVAGDKAQARAHLARAARSRGFDYHFEQLGSLLQDATSALPLSPPSAAQLQALDLPAGSSVDDVAASAVFGHAVIVLSGFARLHEACSDPTLAPAVRADCHGTLSHLARSRDLLSRMIGTSMLSRLMRGTPEEAGWREAWRRLRWLHAQSEPLAPDNAAHVHGVWKHGEVAMLEALLEANQVPLDPPADWDPDAVPAPSVPAS